MYEYHVLMYTYLALARTMFASWLAAGLDAGVAFAETCIEWLLDDAGR